MVFVLPDSFSQPLERQKFIEQVRPDILAVSSHSSHLEGKRQVLEKCGGQVVVVHQHNPEFSSTILLKNSLDKI